MQLEDSDFLSAVCRRVGAHRPARVPAPRRLCLLEGSVSIPCGAGAYDPRGRGGGESTDPSRTPFGVHGCRPRGFLVSSRDSTITLLRAFARACGTRRVTLDHLQAYIDTERNKFYLDGPNNVDWIFRNQIDQDREGAFYVDYIAHDDVRQWSAPEAFEDTASSFSSEPKAVTMTLTYRASAPSARPRLTVVAGLWPYPCTWPETHYSELTRTNYMTLEKLDEQRLLQQQSEDVYRCIVQEWQFPMYDLDLRSVDVKPQDLREHQQAWYPDGY